MMKPRSNLAISKVRKSIMVEEEKKIQKGRTRAHDLTGQTFGDLTVQHIAEHQRKTGGVWWTCTGGCGNTYDVPGTLLVTGRKTHCNDSSHRKPHFQDITNKRFRRLVALYPLEKRSAKGSVIWHCRCDCGTEVDYAYNELAYGNLQSCGCKKKEHGKELPEHLLHVGGTSIDLLKRKDPPSNNTTGVKGVYLVRGRYIAKMVFQQKAYYLGTFTDLESAAEVRREAEDVVHKGTVDFYARWKIRAEQDPKWAEENPVQILVEQDDDLRLRITFLPKL